MRILRSHGPIVTAAIDIGHLRQWIGRSGVAQDDIAVERVRAFNATINDDPTIPRKGDPAPLAFHWCLAPRFATLAETAADGHPKRGDFLPPVPLPRRMWAGGELEFLASLRVGDAVTRKSRIAAVDIKEGRSGPLCFVTLAHEIWANECLCIRERQDVVYRDAARAEPAPPSVAGTMATPFEGERMIDPSPVLLFRYSALTFNSHRIHYDADYATREEGYAGLVVQAPLQATLMLHHVTHIGGCAPRRFSYRAVAALIGGRRFHIRSMRKDDSTIECWSSSDAVPIGMKSLASW